MAHGFQSGTLKVGAVRDGGLVDATLKIHSVVTGNQVGAGRTYTQATSNPKSFLLEPGEYRVTVKEIRGESRRVTVRVAKAETVEIMVDPSGSD